MTQQTDARACVTNLSYDGLNRPTGKTYSNCPATAAVTYDYDQGTNGIGRRYSMAVTGGDFTSWNYDIRGRVTSENKQILPGSGQYTTSFTYNSADLPVTMTYPGDSEVITFNYNSNMQLTKVFNDMGTPGNLTDDINYAKSIGYDSVGRLDTRTLGNGLKQKYLYKAWTDQGGRLDKIVAGSGTWNESTQLFPNTIQKLSYDYDSVGNITDIEQITNFTNPIQTETQSFGYDALNRLTSWQLGENPVKNYNYDAAGNLIEKGDLDLEYNDTAHVHAVTDAGSNSYDYDPNGNQTRRLVHTIVNGQVVTQEFNLGYDADNRLVSVTGVNGTTMSALFTYNGDGQKVRSVINGETIYLVNGYYEQKGSEITKYYFAGASRIAMRKYTIPQTMTLEYFLGDHLGSTSITTDNTGAKVSEMRYRVASRRDEPCPYRVLREGEVRSQHLHLHAGASVTGCDNELESNHCLLNIRVIRVEMFMAIITHHEIPAPQRTYPALSRCTARLRTTDPLHRLLLG